MDLNPDSPVFVDPGRILVEQECPEPRGFATESVDTVSANDFVGHLPDTQTVRVHPRRLAWPFDRVGD